jgi:GR25 family glycosyltransferase involved in LPS biosynthesis
MPARPGHPMTTTCWLEVEQDTASPLFEWQIHGSFSQTFVIMLKLHAIVLNAYHRGAWGTTTSIDGKVINDSVESSIQTTSRIFKVSTMTYETFAGHSTGELKFTKLVRTSHAHVTLNMFMLNTTVADNQLYLWQGKETL